MFFIKIINYKLIENNFKLRLLFIYFQDVRGVKNNENIKKN